LVLRKHVRRHSSQNVNIALQLFTKSLHLAGFFLGGRMDLHPVNEEAQ